MYVKHISFGIVDRSSVSRRCGGPCSFIEQYLNLHRIVTSSVYFMPLFLFYLISVLFFSLIFNEIAAVGFPAEMYLMLRYSVEHMYVNNFYEIDDVLASRWPY